MRVNLYEVGGCVRDSILGAKTKDIDYAVEIPEMIGQPACCGFDAMSEYLTAEGFEIFLSTPEYMTIRARFPRAANERRAVTADFVLCRREGAYTDGRRPDEVFAGTLLDDLARRDFTVNAIARVKNGKFIDPHNGVADLDAGVLRCVGSAEARLREDALRALRAIRFSITKSLTPDAELLQALVSDWLPPLLASVSTERKREELHRCFAHDTKTTLDWLCHSLTEEFREAVFAGGVWLRPTQEKT